MVDLSFPYPAHGATAAVAIVLPADLAGLMAGVLAKQATSPTALAQARLEGRAAVAGGTFAASGSFNAATATLLAGFRKE